MSFKLVLFVTFYSLSILPQYSVHCIGILYPQESESRELKSLDGIWNFRLSPKNDPNLGFDEKWYENPLENTGQDAVEMMPVPSSYNDITQNKLVRDHIGWAWYDRTFWIPKGWESGKRLFLRFGGVNYHAIVWINGLQVLEHAGAHLPFGTELLPGVLLSNVPNRITVAVNNTLSPDTVPQGKLEFPTDPRYPPGYFTMSYSFDFFNYAGIHRSVFLYTTPESYLDDITVNSSISTPNEGIVDYDIKFLSRKKRTAGLTISVTLQDKNGQTVANEIGSSGRLIVSNPNLWWPFTMVQKDRDAGDLYTLVVKLEDSTSSTVIDVYRLKIGIRSIKWSTTSFLINDKPFYFRGFGRHEDFNIRGKGIDNVMIVKDHNLIKWTGANSYRTSHYPYSEEIMDLADRLGIVIINECSAVSLTGFGPKLLENHKNSLRELIQRDKNRPSVVMWSVGNEPRSDEPASEPYFRSVTELARSMDLTRPITLVLNNWNSAKEYAAQFLDIICINRYYGWYSDVGHTEIIEKSMIMFAENWINKFQKPLIVAEYGADTIAGVHMSPDYVFTEEFQVEMMREHFKAFDYLRKNTSLIGEMIWNFADFMTAQGLTRVTGNRKGIFTRDRQPKASAHFLRTRYHLLAQESDNYPIPTNLGHEYPLYNN